MEKRKEVILIIISLILITIVFNSVAQAAVDEKIQIPKTKTWLKSKCIGTGSNWQGLTLEQHVFCFLALKEDMSERKENQSITYLVGKSQNNQGICWPSSCKPYETALAKLVLDKSGLIDSRLTDEWLINHTETYSEVEWYLQVSSQTTNKVRCLMTYDNINSDNIFVFNENGILESLGGSLQGCFVNKTYWLGLTNARECAKKQFNISCEEPVIGNFFFMKGGSWYITTDSVSGSGVGQPPITLNIKSSCIANSSGCNYKGTLWAALAFYDESPETARSFIPYLLMEENGNKGLLPEAFLYKLTAKEEYADKIGALQGTDGLILASGSLNYKYYDSAVAKLTESAFEPKTNVTKLKYNLLVLQKKEGTSYYWDTADKIRDTAMLYLAYWPGYDPNMQNSCAQNGFSCVDNCTSSGGTLQEGFDCGTTGKECCSVPVKGDCLEKYGECITGTSCPADKTQMNYQCQTGICCKNNSRSMCVSELHGTVCIIDPLKDVECIKNNAIVPFITAGDTQYCCPTGGSCVYRNKTCSLLGGEICYGDGKSCLAGNSLPALEDFCCRIGFCSSSPQTCSQKGGFKCNAGEECKNGNMVDASDTSGLLTCCINGGTCMRATCDQTLCIEGETCDGSSYDTIEGLCCYGSCISEPKTCIEMNGQECGLNQKCSTSTFPSKDVLNCCAGTCKEKKKFDATILIIIVVIIAMIALLYFLIKKLKNKKPKKEGDEFGFDEFSEMPGPGVKPSASLPAPSKKANIPAPKKEVKKKEEDEDAFAELEKMSN